MDRTTDALPEPWRTELRRGLAHAATGDFAAAATCFERAHVLAPERPETACALGRERRRAGRHAEAELLLAAAVAADPGFTTAAAELARCLALGARRFAEAHGVLDQAIAAGGGFAQLAAVRAELFLEDARPADARSAAEAALAAAGSEAVREAARAALARVENADGVSHAERGELDAALFAFKRAADLDPEWSAPLVNQGLAFERLERTGRARRAYEQAAVLEPDNEHAHLNLGLLLAGHGDPAGARAALEAACRAAPGWPPALAALAELRTAAGETSEALALLADALRGAPTDPRLWLELGSAWCAAGIRDRAEDCFRAALDLAPDHVVARLRLAELLARDGRYLEATRLAEQARTLDPALAGVFLPRGPIDLEKPR